MSQDINVLLIKKAIEIKKQVIIIPRRSHAVKGIPINFEENILRVWINTGKDIESVLFSEVGHFSFPVELWNMLEQNGIETLNLKEEKPKVEQKEKQDFSSDLGFHSFIINGKYENLSYSELKKKVNEEVKNDRLKNCWIKLIETEENKK